VREGQTYPTGVISTLTSLKYRMAISWATTRFSRASFFPGSNNQSAKNGSVSWSPASPRWDERNLRLCIRAHERRSAPVHEQSPVSAWFRTSSSVVQLDQNGSARNGLDHQGPEFRVPPCRPSNGGPSDCRPCNRLGGQPCLIVYSLSVCWFPGLALLVVKGPRRR